MKRNAIFLAVASLFADAALAQALPTGGTTTAGSGSISTSGSAMTVSQTSTRAIFDFTTFNIGSGYTVNFSGPGGAVLNRVPCSATFLARHPGRRCRIPRRSRGR